MLAIAPPLLLLLVAILLLFLGWRGQVVGVQPVCRRCGFDLTGRPVTSAACAECGADLTKSRAIRQGHRFRRRGMLWAGTTLLLLGIAWGGVIGAVAVRGTNSNPYKPLWMLVSEVPSSDTSVSNAAVAEIVQRIGGGRLSDAQIRSVTEKALAIQADQTRPWLVAWGDLVETARANGRLSQEAWQRYARQAPNLSLEVQPVQSRSAKRLPYFIVLGPARVGSGRSPLFHTKVDPQAQAVWVNALEVPPQPGSFSSTPGALHMVAISKSMQAAQIAPLLDKLSDGPQTLRVKGKLDLFDSSMESGAASIASTAFDLTASWSLQPASGERLRFIRDPSYKRMVEAALSVKSARLEITGDRSTVLSATIEAAGPLPIGLGYDVFARRDGREWKIGQFAAPAGASSRSIGVGGEVTGFSGETIDVVLRSSLEAASKSTDTLAIWDGQVIFRNLKVERGGGKQ